LPAAGPSALTLNVLVIRILVLDLRALPALALHALVLAALAALAALTLAALTLPSLALTALGTTAAPTLAALVLSATLGLLIPLLVRHRLLRSCCEQLVRGGNCELGAQVSRPAQFQSGGKKFPASFPAFSP
jgi:hypothetical protein